MSNPGAGMVARVPELEGLAVGFRAQGRRGRRDRPARERCSMSLTPIETRGYGLPPTVHRSLRCRSLLLLLALLVSCARGASRPEAPTSLLHYPAWIATLGGQLLVV